MHCKEWLISFCSEASSLLVSPSASSPVWQLASLEQVRILQVCLLRLLSVRVSQVPEAEEAQQPQRPLSLSSLSPVELPRAVLRPVPLLWPPAHDVAQEEAAAAAAQTVSRTS